MRRYPEFQSPVFLQEYNEGPTSLCSNEALSEGDHHFFLSSSFDGLSYFLESFILLFIFSPSVFWFHSLLRN